jgi:N-methylhydantoinase B
VWTISRYEALTRMLTNVPVTWRYFVKHQIFAQIGKETAPTNGGAEDVIQAYNKLTTRFRELPTFNAEPQRPAAAAAAE